MIPSVIETSSAEETAAAGRLLADELRGGDVVLLVGGLGAGKTTFVQGLALGLGVAAAVTSPTFTLAQSYAGRLRLVHADLWRLERVAEVADLALEEDLEEGAVLVAEWGEGAADLFGDDALVVEFEGTGPTSRLLRFSPRGARWLERVAA